MRGRAHWLVVAAIATLPACHGSDRPASQPPAHGGGEVAQYTTVRLTADEMRTEFVCIPRPVTRSERTDGGPLRYRVVHSAKLWAPGERPRLAQQVVEGDPGLSI